MLKLNIGEIYPDECINYIEGNRWPDAIFYVVNFKTGIDLSSEDLVKVHIQILDNDTVAVTYEEEQSVANYVFDDFEDDWFDSISDDFVITKSKVKKTFQDKLFFESIEDAIHYKLMSYINDIKKGTYKRMVNSFVDKRPELLC
jgi:hypothetical protein